jgi:xanthine dehydrogenase large subunit
MKNKDTIMHVQGLSLYTGDITLPARTLFATVYTSPYSHGKITEIDFSEAEKCEGIVHIITWKDIPGQNQIGHIIHDEPLLVEEEFTYKGQPIAIVIADNERLARKALTKINLKFEPLPVITDARKAYLKGEIIGTERIFSFGNIDEAKKQCAHIIEGTVESGAQEHLYLETQTALAYSLENGKIKIISSTQSPSAVQQTVSDVLGLPLNAVESEVLRLGGGFGGKEDQANAWAAMAALGSLFTGRAVRLVLPRKTDMSITGKRHPYSCDFKIGLSNDLKILFFEVMYFQNAGAYADLSTAILERTLFHATNSYFIPNVRAKAASCRTNLPPNTAYRGFGGPQAMFVIESAIYEAARSLNIPAFFIQQKNLIHIGQQFPYGMKMQTDNATLCFEKAFKDYNVEKKIKEIEVFNSQNVNLKKGISLMPVCFGISFTSTFLNQASALVHVYNDGSIGISTGAVEMGQGVNEKIRKIAARVLGISTARVITHTTNTTRIANISPTAASTGTDLNGNATRLACIEIKQRLIKFLPKLIGEGNEDEYDIVNEFIFLNGKPLKINWNELIMNAYKERINLSAHAFYATPEIFFDRNVEKGIPFAYHVCGTAISEVTIDCLRGNYVIDRVEVVHDAGTMIDEIIDRGQIEGGIVQGIGWMTMEEILYNENGSLLTNTLSTYKVPDVFSVPKIIDVRFIENNQSEKGVFGAKATGEPPFMYGIGVYFALLNAANAYRDNLNVAYSAPFTNEKLLLMLYGKSIKKN